MLSLLNSIEETTSLKETRRIENEQEKKSLQTATGSLSNQETPPTINNIRTMASDGKQVGFTNEDTADTIYSSTQSSILGEGK